MYVRSRTKLTRFLLVGRILKWETLRYSSNPSESVTIETPLYLGSLYSLEDVKERQRLWKKLKKWKEMWTMRDQVTHCFDPIYYAEKESCWEQGVLETSCGTRVSIDFWMWQRDLRVGFRVWASSKFQRKLYLKLLLRCGQYPIFFVG